MTEKENLLKRIKELEKIVKEQENIYVRLQESEARYKHLFNNALVGLFRANIDTGLFLEMNERGAQMQGVPREEIIGKVRSTDMYEDPKQRELLVEMLKKGGRVDNFDANIVLKTGEKRIFSISVKSYPERNFLEGAVIDVTEKKEMENKMTASEKKYRDLVENSPLGVIIAKERPVRLCFANKSMESLFGHTREELMSYPPGKLTLLIHKDDRNRFFNNFTNRLQGKNVASPQQYKIMHKNGTVLYVEVYSSRIIYDNEPATQTQFLDITKRVEAESALKKSEELYRSLYDNALVGMWKSRISDGRLLKSNMAHAKLSGFESPEEAISKNFCLKDLYEKKDRDILLNHLHQYGEMHSFDAHLKYPDGREQDISVSAKLVDDNKCIEGVVVDISDKKQAERDLKASEKKYRMLFDNLLDMYYQMDMCGQLTLASPSMAETLGFNSPDELIEYSKKNNFFFYLQEKNKLMNTLISQKSVRHFEISLRHKKGNKIICETNSKLVYGSNKNISGFEGIIRDETEKIQTRKRLMESERLTLQKMIEAEENERSRFAIELHDELIPVLSSLKLHIDAIKINKDQEQKNKIVTKSSEIIQRAIDETRVISNNLSPHVISDFGLNVAIKDFIKMIPDSKIKIKYNSNIEEIRFKRIIEIVLFRTTKELIQNTIKHANAANINLDILFAKKTIGYKYHDDGSGFKKEEHVNSNKIKGNGIKNIQKQVSSVGGTIDFHSDSHGLVVFISICI